MKTLERTLEAKEMALNTLAQELYEAAGKIIEPHFPWVLVRIMPKANKIGGIYTPEKQNKTFYEGIVLRTWQPFWKHYTGDLHFDEAMPARVVNKAVLNESSVHVGDRVMFMHFEGQPVSWLDELHYRMIHEVETHPNGGIWGTLHLTEDEGLKAKLDKLFKDKTSRTISGS